MSVARRLRRYFVIVTLLLALAWQSSLGQTKSDSQPGSPRYTITLLPLHPTAINDAGQVVGTSHSFRAATWTKDRGLLEIGVPAGFVRAEGLGINQKSEAIGVAVNPLTNQRQGFSFTGDKLTLLRGRQSKPFAINDSGEISGEAILSPDNISGAVVWDGDVVLDLGGCCGGSATGINNRGEVIANIYNSAGQYQAFLWEKTHGLQTIGTGNIFSSALLINDDGHVLLESFGKGLWLYEDGKLTPIQLSPKYPSRPRYLGKNDVILGSAGPFIDEDHAFTWDRAHGYRDLNDMIPTGTGWELRSATAINSQGEIVGWGDLHGEENVGFLLTPIP